MVTSTQLQRHEQQIVFLEAAGWQDTERTAIAGDASARSYERLTKSNGQTAVLMDAPPEHENGTEAFIRISEYLRDCGLSAPRIYHQDLEHGFLLLEDFGSHPYGEYLNSHPSQEYNCYQEAVNALVILQKSSNVEDIQCYSDDQYFEELQQFIDWYMPVITGETMPLEQQAEFQALWLSLCSLLRQLNPVTVLRDYHSPNLLWLGNKKGVQRVGIIDFQDALIGSPAYDVVSLLEDARRDVSESLADELCAYYLQQRPSLPKEDFLASYAILGAQRNLKILGFAARKYFNHQDDRYLHLIPRMWMYLERDLSHSVMRSIKKWVDRVIPNEKRSIEYLTNFQKEKIHV